MDRMSLKSELALLRIRIWQGGNHGGKCVLDAQAVFDGGANLVSQAADIATTAGVLFAVVASWIGVRSLRSQAGSQRLESLSATNVLWIEVGQLGAKTQALSPSTLRIVQWIYADLEARGGLPVRGGVLGTETIDHALTAGVPFVVGALLPHGTQKPQDAPDDERSYLDRQVARAFAFGYLRAVLRDDARNSAGATPEELVTAREELAAVDRAMEAWVGKMNEIAELYELNVLDRHAFVGKRSVALVQRSFVAEPYILWRNTVKPGRWGLRLLGLGTAARTYQWASLLQENAVGLSVNPARFGPSATYPGLIASLGWAIGAGSTNENPFSRASSYFRLRARLGAPFSASAKRRHKKLINKLPHDVTSGHSGAAADLTWVDTVADPTLVVEGLRLLRGPKEPTWWSSVGARVQRAFGAMIPARLKPRAARPVAGGKTAGSS